MTQDEMKPAADGQSVVPVITMEQFLAATVAPVELPRRMPKAPGPSTFGLDWYVVPGTRVLQMSTAGVALGDYLRGWDWLVFDREQPFPDSNLVVAEMGGTVHLAHGQRHEDGSYALYHAEGEGRLEGEPSSVYRVVQLRRDFGGAS